MIINTNKRITIINNKLIMMYGSGNINAELKLSNGMFNGQPVTTVGRFLAAYVEGAAGTCERKMSTSTQRHKDTN
jgi:hypothetical protein